ncbi:glycosyl transferase family 1 [Roseomonas sp. OT10]|uniref:glycosyl transferase family 1 n=1 Tax=Roseomonas cutis TaxID=2897332 RepID=UPI001E350A98|nr:glycosyl transferase family 1 [Roseomonas sp. OT10]UFN50476.1 glycosyl transferase family 1 [Roseomonas sp. OT10]
MRVAYLVHDLGDAAVERRLRQLRSAGFDLALAGFHRAETPPSEVAGVPAVPMGRTENARLVRRIGSVLGAAARPGAWVEAVRGADIILARQLEMLALGARGRAVAARSASLVYECLDIHRLMLSQGPPGRALRALEGALLRRTDLLLVSSPAFVENHFARAYPRLPPTELVENRVLEEELSPEVLAGPPPPPVAGPPWRIGWFGMLRCRRSLELLAGLTRALPGQVEVVLRGRPALDALGDLEGVLASAPGMRFDGPYDRRRDLAGMYAGVHFTWAIDFYEAGANSDWLLPNRLYEGGAHGAVPLAMRNVETGRWLARHGAGIRLEEPLGEALRDLFAGMTAEQWGEARRAAAAVPRAAYVDGPEAAARLAEALSASVSRDSF